MTCYLLQREKKKSHCRVKSTVTSFLNILTLDISSCLNLTAITLSMSRRGNLYDNALAENFFSILKTEYINRAKFVTVKYNGGLKNTSEVERIN